jgi:hypothetical protein
VYDGTRWRSKIFSARVDQCQPTRFNSLWHCSSLHVDHCLHSRILHTGGGGKTGWGSGLSEELDVKRIMMKAAGKLNFAKRSGEAIRRSPFGVLGVDRRSKSAANTVLVISENGVRVVWLSGANK